MSKFKNDLDKHLKDESCPLYLSSLAEGFGVLENAFSEVAEVTFMLKDNIASVIKENNELKFIIDKNKAMGNIVNEVEKSSAYEKLCTDVKNSSTLWKVIGIDFGEKLWAPI